MADPTGADKADAVFPPFDPEYFASSLFWLVVIFPILYWLFAKIAIPRIATVIEERRDQVADDLDQAAELKRQTDDAIAAYERSLADAKAKASGIAADTKQKLDAEISEMRAKMEADLATKTEAAEKRIAAAKETASASVREIAEETADAIVVKLIGESADTKQAVDAALAPRS